MGRLDDRFDLSSSGDESRLCSDLGVDRVISMGSDCILLSRGRDDSLALLATGSASTVMGFEDRGDGFFGIVAR